MTTDGPANKDWGLLIGGHWRKEGQTAEIRNPYNNDMIAIVRRADRALMDGAIGNADAAFEATRALTTHERERILERIATGLRFRIDEIASTIMAEAGKPISLARGEVERGINTFEIAAREVHRIEGETIPLDVTPAGARRFGLTKRFPLGPVGAITPFNFPLNLAAHKVAAAIAVGNPMILRPASQTPVTALILGEIALEAGLPEGGLNVVPSPVEQAEQMVLDGRLKMISFTGSPAVGWPTKVKAGKKKVALELGGNAAAIIGHDANLEFAIPRLAAGAYGYAGQTCISVQRLFVHYSLMDEFVDSFSAYIDIELGVGDPTDEKVICGPVITNEDADRIEQWVEEAIRCGARQVLGGKRDRNVLWPQVITGVSPAMNLNAKEVFGPVVTVAPYHTIDEAIEKVNDSRYGLQAGIFTRNVHDIFKAFERIDVGGVIANDYPTFRVDNMPYGGIKDSGFGREGVKYTIEEMTELKLLVLNLE